MATPIVAGEDIEVTIYCDDSEQIGINVVHYEVASFTGTPTYETLATAFSAQVAAVYIPWLNDTASYAGLKIRKILTLLPPMPWFSTQGTALGSGGDSLPRQLSGLIRKRINAQGPKGRGRFYASFPGADMHLLGNVSAAGIAQLGLIEDVFFNQATNLSVSNGGGATVLTPMMLNRTPAPSFSPLHVTSVSGEFATQRRRGFFGRPNALPAELGS